MIKVAFVTGGTRGIGLGIAKKLAENGYSLALNGVRDENQIKNVLDEFKSAGSDVIYCQGDISIASKRAEMLNKIKAHFGQLNILVNNAGIAPAERRDILEATEKSFDDVLSINLKGTYFLTQAVANWMIQQKENDSTFTGSIITISSISATVASTNRGEYCIAKAGLSMVTQLFATRLGEFEIPVYEIRPGIITSDMTAGVVEKYDKLIENGLTLQKRWGLPEDIGRAVVSIAKGDFPYSTGQVFMIDGGLTLSRL